MATLQEQIRYFLEQGIIERQPFKLFRFNFVISEERKHRAKLPPKPVIRSRYANELFEIGAGWNE